MEVRRSARKRKIISKRCFMPNKDASYKNMSRCAEASHNHCALFPQEIEEFHLPTSCWTKNVRKNQENHVAFAQLYMEKLGIPFFCNALLSLTSAISRCMVLWKSRVQNLGCKRPTAVYESQKSFPTLILSCAISKTELQGLCWLWYCNWRQIKRDTTVLSFFLKPTNYPSDTMFLHDDDLQSHALPVR